MNVTSQALGTQPMGSTGDEWSQSAYEFTQEAAYTFSEAPAQPYFNSQPASQSFYSSAAPSYYEPGPASTYYPLQDIAPLEELPLYELPAHACM
jgi:hypothetical protein